jgi:hypothetical protein
MRKGTLLLVVLSLLIATAACAVTTGTANLQLYGQFNQFAAPLIPFDPNPRNIINPGGPFAAWQSLINVADYAQWIEPTSQSLVTFPNDWDIFPNIVMGDGYLGYVAGDLGTNPVTLTYDGVDISDTDAYISLPGMTGGNGGWHYIGIPYPPDKSVLFYDIVVTDGSESHTMMDLLINGTDWLSLSFGAMDAPTQSIFSIPDSGDYLQGGQMYQVFTMKNDLALILPHPL